MNQEEVKKLMKKQGYRFVGNHSAIKICRWTKKSLIDEGVCYKEQFYGIKSHRCCQMSVWLDCQNQCVHCWRAIEFNFGKIIDKNKIDNPNEIINNCIKEQQKILQGFKSNKKLDKKKFDEAMEPTQFAISLIGEGTLYPKLGEFIEELRKKNKTSFLVTNGLCPEKIKELEKNNQLPTQLYVSVNTPNKELYKKFHRSSEEHAWEKLNETLGFLPKLKNKTRTVFRMNLVRDLNMVEPENYAKMIKKSGAQFIEIKGYVSVGFARKRLGYDRMPTHDEMREFSKKLVEELNKIGEDTKNSSRNFGATKSNLKDFVGYKILDEKIESRVLVLGKDKKELKIKNKDI